MKKDKSITTFDDIYRLAQNSGSEAAFNKAECEVLFDLANEIPKDGLVVEIGLQFGRSTTVLGSVAKIRGFKFIGIDNWQEEVSADAKKNIKNFLIGELGLPIELINKDSKDAHRFISDDIDLLHVDGGHDYEEVMSDCNNFLSKIKKGGYVCFDDYGHDSLPGVFRAVTEYMSEKGGWKYLGRYGNKMGVFKKL